MDKIAPVLKDSNIKILYLWKQLFTMQQYLDLVQKILDEGVRKDDRTGTGTLSIFGYQVRFALQKGFPLLTTKKVHTRSIIYELLWLLRGDTNIQYLHDHNVSIWDEWADANGDLGPVYGAQWRNWNNEGIDQIANVVNDIKNNPDSRRLIVSAWNPSVLPNEHEKNFAANVAAGKAALPPCHAFFQFYVTNGKLSCQLYQRSADVFLGVPFNIASYALLTHMIAQVCNLEVGDFVHTFGDVHIYNNLVEQCELQLSRTPRELPTLRLNPEVKDLFDFTYEDIEIQNYDPHPAIKGNVSI